MAHSNMPCWQMLLKVQMCAIANGRALAPLFVLSCKGFAASQHKLHLCSKDSRHACVLVRYVFYIFPKCSICIYVCRYCTVKKSSYPWIWLSNWWYIFKWIYLRFNWKCSQITMNMIMISYRNVSYHTSLI